MSNIEKWDNVIKPKAGLFDIDLREIWKYRDLLNVFVYRDIVSVYKQTVLGPAWIIIQTILTSFTLTTIFGYIAGMPTDNTPKFLFYMAGTVLWNYFADCLNKTSNVFISNASIFGKVYFPRLIVPLSILVSNLVKLFIQLIVFFLVYGYFVYQGENISPNKYALALPLLILIAAGLGLAFGILVSSVTTKYRDFTFLIGFGVQLLMYASPVVYPLSSVREKYRSYFLLNPMSSIIEGFKYSFLGNGYFSWYAILYSFVFMVIVLFTSIIIFNRVEKTFMDTV